MSPLLRFRRWWNTRKLIKRGAQLFSCQTRDDRQLYLRDHYWLYRSWGLSHSEAMHYAVGNLKNRVRLRRSTDEINDLVYQIIAKFKQMKPVPA